MDELLKMLIEAAEKEGKVHVIKKTVNKDNSIEKGSTGTGTCKQDSV